MLLGGRSRDPSHSLVQRLLEQCLLLLLLSALLGLATYAVHPRVPDYQHGIRTDGELTIADIRSSDNVLWVDARSEAEYDAAHLPGAVLLNEESFNSQIGNFLMQWDGEQTVVVYCALETCSSSRAIARRLREEVGVPSAYHLQGGWEALVAAGRANPASDGEGDAQQ